MLVLSRKPGEAIVVGASIRVTVLEVRGGRVRLGIEAPAHVNVRRQELTFDAEKTPPLRVETAVASHRAATVT